MDMVRTVKVSRRRMGRRTFLAVAGLGACGAGVLAAPHVAPLLEQGLQQAALNAAAAELDQLEGVSLDAALEAAQITAAAVRVIVVPVARLVATLGLGALQAVPKHSRKTMVRLRELDTSNRGLLILHAAVRGQCA